MFFPCNCFPIFFSLSNLFSFGNSRSGALRTGFPGIPEDGSLEHFSGILKRKSPFTPGITP